MSKRTIYFCSGFLFFIAFLFFSLLVERQVFTRFDIDTTARLQHSISRWVDVPFSILSLVGSVEVSGIFLIVLLIMRRKVFSGIITLIFFGATHIFELYGKTFVKHPGPPVALLRYDLGFNFPSALIQPGSSYPSGHTARAFFLTTILFLLALRSKKFSTTQMVIVFICLTGYDFFMCLSRVYLAEHWTSDVVGGMLSGLGLALIGGAYL